MKMNRKKILPLVIRILSRNSMRTILLAFYRLFFWKKKKLLFFAMGPGSKKIINLLPAHRWKERKLKVLTFPIALLFLILVTSSGCAILNPLDPKTINNRRNESFKKLYENSFYTPFRQDSISYSKKKHTLSAVDIPLSLFALNFSDVTGYGIVCSSELAEKTVDLEFKEATAVEVIELLSKQLGKDFILRGNTFFIGSLKKGDRSFFVRSCRFMSKSDASNFCQGFISEFGKVHVTSSGIISVMDVEPVINSLNLAFQQLEKIKVDTFICQLYFVHLSDGWQLDAGLKTRSTGSLAYSLSKGQGGNFDFQDVGAEMELIFSGGSSLASLLASPLLLCLSDQEVTWSDGQVYPIPLRNVSSEGTVTTTSYQFKNTGFQLKLKLVDLGENCNIFLSITNSQISGWVEEQPILDSSSLTSIFSAKSNFIYLVGELKQNKRSNGIINTLTFRGDHSSKNIQVFFRFYRVSPEIRIPKSSIKTLKNGQMISGSSAKREKIKQVPWQDLRVLKANLPAPGKESGRR